MNRKLVILLWDFSVGGVQRLVQQFLEDKDVLDSNLKIFLIIFNQKEPELVFQNKNCNKIYFPNYEKAKLIRYLLIFPGFKILLKSWWLYLFFKKNKPDKVLSYANELSLIASICLIFAYFFSRLRVKLIIVESTLLSRYVNLEQKWFWRYLSRLPYFFASYIITATKTQKKDLVCNFGANLKKIKIIKNWV